MSDVNKKTRKEKRKDPIKLAEVTPVVSIKLVRRLGILIAIIAFALYANTFKHGFVLDDFSVIKENYVVKNGTGSIPTILTTHYRYGYWNGAGDLYRPMSLIMFAVEWDLFGYDEYTGTPEGKQPVGMHVINVLLYALTGLVLFFTLRKVLKDYNLIIPFVAVLLFIAHPIHTEVIANIKSRDEILSFLFVILSIQWLWKYFEDNKILHLIVSLFFFFISFMSKEGTVTFLAVIPLMIYFFTEKEGMKKRLITILIYLVPTLIYLGLRYAILGSLMEDTVAVNDNLLMAARNDSSIFDRELPTAILILGYYLRLLFMPHPLSSDYSYDEIPLTSFGDWRVLIVTFIYVVMGVMALVGLWMTYKRRKNPGLRRNFDIPVFGLLFFFATFSLYANILTKIGTSLGERLLFVPTLGFCLIISYLLSKIFKTQTFETITAKGLGGFIKKFPAVLAIVAVLTIVYGFKTIERNKDWENNYTLYSTDVKKATNSSRIHYHYGLTIVQDKAMLPTTPQAEKIEYLNKAITEFTRAAEINPHNPDLYDQMALAYLRKGDHDEALKYFEKCVSMDSIKARPYSNMGMIYFNKGNYQKALKLYEKAVKLDPRFADAWYNLGSTYGTLQMTDKAIIAFQNCLKYDPEKPEAHYFLGFTYMSNGQNSNAIQSFTNCIRYNPRYALAYFNLGKLYEIAGNISAAKQNYEKAYSLNPGLKN